MQRLRILARSLALGVALAPSALAAQELGGGMGAQSLRPYWHVFIAYAVAILIVLGWVVSLARRLSSLERRLDSM